MMWVCTGCSCLCDDIEIEGDVVRHACRIGAGLYLNRSVARTEPLIDGKQTDIDSAIERAVEILKDSKRVAIYGLNNSTLEAQKIAMKLAEKISAYVDNGSKFGKLAEMILRKEIPSTTLENVKDYAYVIFYWGCDIHNSMPRHMSRYTYYPRGKKRQRGYEEDRFLVVVDVRKSHTAMLAKKNAIFIKSDDDRKIIREFLTALEGGIASGDVLRVVKEIKKSDFNVIFGGGGLIEGLGNELEEFVRFVSNVGYFIPTDYRTNSMGFFKSLFEAGIPKANLEDLLIDEAVDTAIIVGSDPLDSMPFDVAKKLAKLKLIVIDPKVSFTSKIADVVIPSAISGVECGGRMLRSDFTEVELKPIFKSEFDDAKILKSILGGL